MDAVAAAGWLVARSNSGRRLLPVSCRNRAILVIKVKKERIAVAMSGGVDSSVTACLLLERGYAVEGVFMALAQPDLDSQIARVTAVTEKIGVSLRVIDLSRAFADCVLAYFRTGYLAGRTPNPCMICNPNIKFGRLLDEVLRAGCARMATGHYVRLASAENGRVRLLTGLDPGKDQSYFLSQLTQEKLQRLLFPLGELHKKTVYEMAASFGIAGIHGRESQDVCFLKDTDVRSFLEKSAAGARKEGKIVDLQGNILGDHSGIHHYTVGQRRGLGLPDASPYYVVRLDGAGNAVVVGKKEDLLSARAEVGKMNWLSGTAPPLPARYRVRIRYRHQPAPALVSLAGQDRVLLRFDTPQRAITPGQFAVLYDNDEVIGGGELL